MTLIGNLKSYWKKVLCHNEIIQYRDYLTDYERQVINKIQEKQIPEQILLRLISISNIKPPN